jgi:hypothetical protein
MRQLLRYLRTSTRINALIIQTTCWPKFGVFRKRGRIELILISFGQTFLLAQGELYCSGLKRESLLSHLSSIQTA